MWMFVIFLILLTGNAVRLVMMASNPLRPSADEMAERIAEEKISALHQVDTMNLMLYTLLMILTVLTVWIFKYRRLRFVHETGVTLIYGLIVGLIIKLSTKGSSRPPMTAAVVPFNMTVSIEAPPDYLRLSVPYYDVLTNGNRSILLRYKFDTNDNEFREALLEEKATFDSEIFFNILLPPIIFNAGYSLKKRHFFRNIGSILVYAVFGTSISCVLIGIIMYGVTSIVGLPFSLSETLLFGAMISATDPVTILAVLNEVNVDANLFALVFGESALNDAVAIVLSQTIEKYSPSTELPASSLDGKALVNSCGRFFGVFFGSMGVGSLVGCVASLFMKFTKISQFPLLESSLFILMSYLSFLVSEAAHLTGIVSVLFCGICQAHYTFNNLSTESKCRTKQFFEVLNFLSENFIFTYIGVSLFTSQAHLFNIWFIIGAFVAIFLGRVLHIYPLTALLNLGRTPPIPMNNQHMMVFAGKYRTDCVPIQAYSYVMVIKVELQFSGLRGAMAFALAIRNTSSSQMRIMYSTTSLIVIFTVLVNGGLASHMLQLLKIKYVVILISFIQRKTITITSPSHHRYNKWDKSLLPQKWYDFDNNKPASCIMVPHCRFLKPFLTNCKPSLMETLPAWCAPVSRVFTTSVQLYQVDGWQACKLFVWFKVFCQLQTDYDQLQNSQEDGGGPFSSQHGDDLTDAFKVSMDRIDDYVYLSNAKTANNSEELLQWGINRVLTVDIKPVKRMHQDIRYYFVHMEDDPNWDLLSSLKECLAYIESSVIEGNAILVHCFLGISRSPAVATAYLMRKYKLDADEALRRVRNCRPIVWYVHARCSLSNFVNPVEWMNESIACQQGKLLCPRCSARLGSFRWAGLQCGCGKWVIPGFSIQKCKVDTELLERQLDT
ncbi:sodium:hydrogen exchanger 6 [Trichuris trichiura]|uniref:Sodium/hydrogen exchanger n=1 Tax=Trichuris trichiura TaxID=36087 RepID=A0A077ZDE3_TRITR|nr:sodium:hydrogen exchanger 6 [Trichuris trichiura]